MTRARDLADLGTSFSGTENNVSLGENALDSVTTGTNNVALGEDALGSNTTASNNTAVGYQALLDNTTGANLVAVGEGALANNTTASDNIAVGKSALNANTTGTFNTAVGKDALATNQTSNSNTAIGKGAGSSTTVAAGTYVGSLAGENTNSVSNTFVGANAGQTVTSGSKNTIIGRYNGNENNLDIRTSNNRIVLSDGDGNPRMFYDGVDNWFAGNLTAGSYWPAQTSVSGQNAIMIGNTSGALGVSTNDAVYLNKNNGDGTIVLFYSAGGLEGTISISGSTTSFNGGHLSRWSQLADGSRDNTLVKGTVMTNLDQMAVWEHDAVAEGDTIKNAMGETVTATADDVADAYTENNEQLNCMAVSSVEGDPNVAGVFVDWDDQDDGYNDLKIAMTGDMVIRIAQGTIVARGDLLMSAGDGTAKPQGDDIVRSKTIAKVTSTNVSHTYDDGSYLVPCVLMAC